jgi:uncharacterized protein YkwD
MKILSQIIIVVFVALSLFIMRDDVFSAINKISTYLDKNVKQSIVIKSVGKQEVPLPGKVEEPGALRVVDSILNPSAKNSLTKEGVIAATNNNRKDVANLPALIENSKLDISAQNKLTDMFTKQYFEHTSPSGVSISNLGEQVGYEYILIGENLAMGNFKNDGALLDAWMASPGHRANILNTHYTEIGVAVGRGKFEGKDTWMAVQHFGAPRSICPSIDQVLYGVININQTELDKMGSDLMTRLSTINKNVVSEGSTLHEQINNYNSLINIYNNLIKITKEKIADYNKQISAFNLCVSGNQ